MKRSAYELRRRSLLPFSSCKQSLTPITASWGELSTSRLAIYIYLLLFFFYPSTPQILVVTSNLLLRPHREDTSVFVSHRMNFKKQTDTDGEWQEQMKPLTGTGRTQGPLGVLRNIFKLIRNMEEKIASALRKCSII